MFYAWSRMFTIILVFLPASFIMGQDVSSYGKLGIEINSFFDIQQQFQLSPAENKGIDYGQFEIGFSRGIASFISAEGAIAYNGESEKFELGSALCNIQLFGQDDTYLYRHNIIVESGIKIGQFDIPFGLDYRYIPSPDRKFISSPLIVDRTINAMNNLGLNLYTTFPSVNLNLFAVNGLMEDDLSIGGRLGALPIENLELGFSWLTNLGETGFTHCHLMGFDLSYQYSIFELRAEFINSDGILDGCLAENSLHFNHNGYYIQALTYLQEWISLPLYSGFRVAEWLIDYHSEITGPTKKFSFLMGYSITGSVDFRIEFQDEIGIHSQNISTITSQIVLSF